LDLEIIHENFQVISNEISGHIYSNSCIFLNFHTNECFTITELPRSIYMYTHVHIHTYIYVYVCLYIYICICICAYILQSQLENNLQWKMICNKCNKCMNFSTANYTRALQILVMGWLRLVGSLKSQVSFAEYSLFYRALLQKRPIVLLSLLIVATPYLISELYLFQTDHTLCGILRSF